MKNKKSLIIALFIIILVFIIGSCIYYFTTKENKDNNSILINNEISEKVNDEIQSSKNETKIKITVGDTEIDAVLNNTVASQELINSLPVTVSMTRMGEHEYYGSIGKSLSETDEQQTGYEIGDIAYWTPGDLLAFYFDEPDKDPEGLIILGRITTDISVFDNLKSNEQMKIELEE